MKIAFVLLLSASAAAQRIPSRTGDSCTDELEDVLKQWFGGHARVEWRVDLGKVTPLWTLVAKTNLCDGLIEAQFNHFPIVCNIPHYGGRPPGLVAAWGFGSCADLLGGQSIYPR